MRKKILLMLVLLCCTACLLLVAVACDDDSGNQDADQSGVATSYVIQYTDNTGTHTLEVMPGAPYSMPNIPQKEGYEFTGLYDAETGGTQYVNAQGTSLSPFTDNKNIVLFAQFRAKEYTIVLDYQGAEVTGQRSVTVKYNEKLPELPENLFKEHSTFAGWYTEANCGGTQVADAYGLIPDKSTLNSSLFNIEGIDEYLYLYAGFNVETFTVTFNFDSGIPSEEIEVEWNTPISEIIPETRNAAGKAVLSWSKTQGGDQIFTGKITENVVLYAVEWAPVIELDLNGGEGIVAVIAREATTVTIPTPTRTNYKFLYWETNSGSEANITKMPAEGAELKAVWQAMLVFDENGGTAVNDISQKVGTAVTLPTPEKAGFIFAGWYTSDGTRYTTASMPVESVEVKAGWYKAKTETVILVESNKGYSRSGVYYNPRTDYYCFEFLYNKYFEGMDSAYVTIDWHIKIRNNSNADMSVVAADFYSKKVISSNYLIATKRFENVTSTYREFTFTTTFNVSDNFYCCWYYNSNDGGMLYLSDYYYTVHFPDTTYLYL